MARGEGGFFDSGRASAQNDERTPLALVLGISRRHHVILNAVKDLFPSSRPIAAIFRAFAQHYSTTLRGNQCPRAADALFTLAVGCKGSAVML